MIFYGCWICFFLPWPSRPTVNDLSSQQHEKASFVCVRAQRDWNWCCVHWARVSIVAQKMLNHEDTNTEKLKTMQPTLVCEPLWRAFFFLGKPRKKRLARLIMIIAAVRSSIRARCVYCCCCCCWAEELWCCRKLEVSTLCALLLFMSGP